MKTLSKIFLAICLIVVANGYAQVKLGIPIPSEEKPPIDIPFAIAEEKPMFEACKIHLKYTPKSLAARIEGRAMIVFRINTDGTVTIIGKRSTDEILEEEAVFLINSLPCLIPGKMKGVPTAVTFAYPINFKLPDNSSNNK